MSSLASMITLVMVLIYAVSALKLNSIHQIFHAENLDELHSVVQENDPCHKNIYHQQTESGCEHKSHITENTKCSICEHSASSKEILSSRLQTELSFQFPDYNSIIFEGDYSCNLIARVGRGPPQV